MSWTISGPDVQSDITQTPRVKAIEAPGVHQRTWNQWRRTKTHKSSKGQITRLTHTDASWKITCNALFEWSEAEELVSAAGCSHSHWCPQLVKLTNAGKKFLRLNKFSLETLQMWRRKVPRAVSALGQEAVTWTQQGDEGRTEPELIKYNYDDQRWRAGRGWDLGHHEKSAGLNVWSQRQKLKW